MNLVCKTAILMGALVAAGVPANLVYAQGEKRPDAPANQAKDERHGDPYYLATCPVSDEKLGSMGDPIIKIYDGREIRFCCKGCISKFEKDKAANLAKVDGRMTKDQLALYPQKTSLVSAKVLPAKPVDFIHNNRLIRLIDAQEKERFLKEPARYLGELDKAVISKQGKDYPLKTCVVSGEKFGGSMGAPVDLVVANRMIRICCNGCKKELEKTPADFIAKVDLPDKGSKKEP